MNTLLLQPSDILFFRDGRPMGGSLSGHGAAWPLPTVPNAALHAALHRADIKDVHAHRRGCSGSYNETRDRKFGSLVTAGPFPVVEDQWLFPRPLDAGNPGSALPTFLPLQRNEGDSFDISWQSLSSLPKPLAYAAANTESPTKIAPAPWWNKAAWQTYLGLPATGEPSFHLDDAFSDSESAIGIGIDPETATQDGERFYSAHYLRLREDARMGLLAEAWDKQKNNPAAPRDLIRELFPNSGSQTPIIVGGQQRVCAVERNTLSDEEQIPLPTGMVDNFHQSRNGSYLVKWVLLTPAVFPAINDHTGGWLPSWIRHTDGQIMLKSGNTERNSGEGRETWRKRIGTMQTISATLVAAIVGKPIPVTGYMLPHLEAERSGGPKPTHLAVPAGSVYYFETTEPEKLAAALNWHGDSPGTEIRNRRSTLFGEKGFGLGVCGTWTFHDGKLPTES